MKRIVLAYSGSSTTTAAIAWLAAAFDADVVTVTVDLGQAQSLAAVRDQALAAGAVRAHVVDARAEFAEEVIVPALAAGALAAADDPLVTALGQPLIAKHLVHVAGLEDTNLVAHGGDPASADGVRLEQLVAALAPSFTVIAPVGERTWRMPDDADAPRAGVAAHAGVCEIDANLWGRTVEVSGSAGGAAKELPRQYVRTRRPAAAPDVAAEVELSFDAGTPIAVNGVPLSLVDLIASVETIAGAHGVGRLQAPADASGRWRLTEAPAAVVLSDAYRALQRHVTPPDVGDRAADHARTYARLVVAGAWYTPARTTEDARTAAVRERLTGTARVRLFQGHAEVLECQSPLAAAFVDPGPAVHAAAGRS